MTENIEIIEEGKVLSRIYSGSAVGDVLKYISDYPSVFIVYDRNVGHLLRALSGNPKLKGSFPIKATEDGKVMDTVLSICNWLLENNADRNSLLLAVGGGIVTDMAGFSASIYKRGIRFAYIPTTLLSQVDAAIGGKTGVNFHSYKNMLGVIRQPEFTFLCPQPLSTLPFRDFVSGEAELLKTFIISNIPEKSYQKCIALLSDIFSSPDRAEAITSHQDELQDLIHRAAAIKAGVVSRDQYEKGERRKLNLGHTFAHAIESIARSSVPEIDITHGEAVAMGIVAAARLSERMAEDEAGRRPKLETEIAADFARCGLPVKMPFPFEDLAKAMAKDKKAEGDRIHFVLIRAIGDTCDRELTIEEAMSKLVR